MMTVRFKIFPTTSAFPKPAHFCITKLIAFPTAKRKEGKTRSVGVKPCHLACNKGEKVTESSPAVFTMIIKQMVIPRNTSRAKNRLVGSEGINNCYEN